MIEVVLPGIPLLLLVVSLLLGRYPGLETALRIGDRLAPPPSRRLQPALGSPRIGVPAVLIPRGGLLLAHSLSGRAPPA
jgi:hypothetical protein